VIVAVTGHVVEVVATPITQDTFRSRTPLDAVMTTGLLNLCVFSAASLRTARQI